MSKHAFEIQSQKQPNTLDLYLEKINKMEARTLIKYNSRWQSLISSKFTKNEKELAPRIETLINSVIAAAKSYEIKNSTFRQYKASICFGLASTLILLKEEQISEEEMEAGINYQFLSNLYKKIVHEYIDHDLKDHIDIPDRTSALKKKSFPEPFYDYLNSIPCPTEDRRNSRFDLMLKFVNANLLIGLRPIEWLNSKICSDIKNKDLIIFVDNAKNSFGRANGDTRELRLVNIGSNDVNNILAFYVAFQNKLMEAVADFKKEQFNYTKNNDIDKIKESNVLNYVLSDYEPTKFIIPLSEILDQHDVPQKGLAEYVLDSIQNEMQLNHSEYLSQKNDVDSKKITLYSTRHQCIANAKSSKVNAFEIAAFFGHSSIETNTRHYGKAWSGWSNFQFKPSLESIKNVTNSLSYLEKEYGYIEPKQPVFTNNINEFNLGLG